MIESVVEQSITLLVEQLGVDRSAVEVRSAEETTWRDGALGCPKPGFGYTQALVPGVRVVLVVGGTAYAFHQGGNRPPFHCPEPTEPLPG